MRGSKGNGGISMATKPRNPGAGKKDFPGRSQEMLLLSKRAPLTYLFDSQLPSPFKASSTLFHDNSTLAISLPPPISDRLRYQTLLDLRFPATLATVSPFPISCFDSSLNQSRFPSLSSLKVSMAKVIEKFFVTSMLMWAVPIAILYAFNNNLFPGSADMSPYSVTLISGFLAVVSVNIVIAFYIYLAMKEPSEKHEPDPKFVSEAEASVKHLVVPNQTQETESTHKKEE
ncbi:unnamed protein product [Lactuca virosa]|uniref:Vacuolar ATPase assembly integral membrane protein VMA21 homolog n=1 Tax=Lactuca virosa TaxID=75947 RepID=A0AAU9N970_9ASTR|nr:unnamed protein product [Lactuca virosa]